MAKKKAKSAAAATQAQLPDAKGTNPKRDARRPKGGADVVTFPKSGGSAHFRKSRRLPE